MSEKEPCYELDFYRWNKITFIVGIFYAFLAIINLPFAYNPETASLNFGVSGKPGMVFGANISAYVNTGFIPLIIGVAFMVFSILTSGKIFLSINDDGTATYTKKGFIRHVPAKHRSLNLKENLQTLEYGKRHQRFVIWVPVAITIFLIYLLFDYINFLNLSFDITTYFFGLEYSIKSLLFINIFYLIFLMMAYTIFPRKAFKMHTSEEILQFDYVSFNVKKNDGAENALLNPIIFSSINEKQAELPENERQITDEISEIIHASAKKHFPAFLVITSLFVLVLMIAVKLIPNYFLGSFTLRIEFFMTIGAMYFLLRFLQNDWYQQQDLAFFNDGKNVFIKRSNQMFGNSGIYLNQVESMTTDAAAFKPHFLEYVLFFFPIVMILWMMSIMVSFATHFLTSNPFTWLHGVVSIVILAYPLILHVFPYPSIKIMPKNQSEHVRTKETFHFYFPTDSVLKGPAFGDIHESRAYIKNTIEGILIWLIPIVFGILWIVLSSFELIPSIFETIL